MASLSSSAAAACMVSQSEAEPMMMPTSGWVTACPAGAARVGVGLAVGSRRHCIEQCPQGAKQLAAGHVAAAAAAFGLRRRHPGCPLGAINLRPPARELGERRRALGDQPFTPVGNALEGLG